MARTKKVVVSALHFAGTLGLSACVARARPVAQSGTASSDPTHTHLHDVRNANARLLALLPRYLLDSASQLGAANDGSAPHSSPARRSLPAATPKIIAGAVVGGVALTTLLLAALLLWRRTRRPPPAAAVVGVRARDTPGDAMDLPKIAPLTVDTGSRAPVYRVLTPLQRSTPTPTLAATPVDLVAKPRRCSDWSALSPSSPTSRPSTAPGSPSSPRLRTVGSNGSLTFAPSAYQPTVRPKASTASLRSQTVRASGLPSLQPLIIPPVATSSTPSTALSAAAASPETLKRQRSLASMLDMKSGSSHLDSPSADTLRAETPRAVVRYEADALISGCNEGRPVRYEVEEDAGTWSEEVVRLPPRYSTLQSAPAAVTTPPAGL
ncbi:hypothetical protein AURDEDRAFT_112539 [Auricularia subglabra TFB-10046 SS5]|nr:hypothetical protein AURDEDRAFT_112539 [Auricularia subglabra TFB-10046 SS5]